MGDSLLTADLGAALPTDPVAANAVSLGAPANLIPKNPAVAVPKKTEDTFTIARRQREAGENPARDPAAQNPHSSAGGNNQIIDRTWLDLMGKYRPELVEGKTKDEILAMKLDGPLNDQMAEQYDRDNAKFMASNGIAPTPNMLNAAYRAGPQGALAIVQAAHSNPNTLVKDVAPDMATPGNNGAGNLTVGQFLMNPYQHGPGADAGSSPQQLFTIAKGNQILAQLQADSDQGRDRLAKLDRDYKPIEFPKMPKPPEVDPLQTFGSLAGVFATLAAGFSRTPMTAALNGLAGAMDSAKKAKWEDYQAHYEQFKFGTEMAIRAHEMHSADVKDALEMMTKNLAAGTAMLNATIALSEDQEMHKHMELGDYVAVGRLQDERNKSAQDVKERLPVTYATADLTAALENLKHAQTGGDPAEIARAETLVQQAETRLAGVKRAEAGGAGTAGIGNPIPALVNGQPTMVLYDKNARQYQYSDGRPLPPDATVEPTGKPSAAADKEANVKTLALDKFRSTHGGRDPVPGNAADQTEMARLQTEQRQHATAMAGRTAQMVGRGLTNAADAITDIKNVVELPISIDTGIFGGRRQGPGLMAASKEILANEVTAEDAQAYNASLAGLERSLGGLSTGGLQVSEEVMRSFGQLQIHKGDTNLIKLRKLGIMRQNVENALDAMSANPSLDDRQRAMVDRLHKDLLAAVPWSPHDVTQVEFSPDNTVTVGQFAKQNVPGSGQSSPDQQSGPKDGQTGTSKSGKPIVFRNGQWEYQ